LLQDDVARYLSDKITPIESSCGEAESLRRHPEIAAHCQRRKADIYPVNAEQIGDNRERQETPIDLTHCRAFRRFQHRCSSPPSIFSPCYTGGVAMPGSSLLETFGCGGTKPSCIKRRSSAIA